MASSVSSPPSSSPNPVGLWFCQISSSLQGGRADPPQMGAKNGAGGGTVARRATRAAPDAAGSKGGDEDDTPRQRMCRRDAMLEATVYLLLDRFAPS